MSGRTGTASVGGFLISLLAMLCVLGPAAHGMTANLRSLDDQLTSSSTSLTDEFREHVSTSVGTAAARVRQEFRGLPTQLPTLLLTYCPLAALLTLLASRGVAPSRAANSLGRQLLITFGIDRR